MKLKKCILAIIGFAIMTAGIFADETKNQVELTLSINWNFGLYKESTFSNITQGLITPRFQLETKIFSGNFLHKITADYFFAHPDSAMTNTAVVYKNYDPITGESYYESSQSNLSFHRIRLQYDAVYELWQNEKFELYVGGNFACNAYLQFEHYPSITGLISVGPASVLKYTIDDRNSLFLAGSMPLAGFGVRPPFAGCDAELMKYAEEDFMKIFTLGKFLSLHNYQSLLLDFEYKLQASQKVSTGLGVTFEYSRVAVPKERPLYYLDGSLKTLISIIF